MKLIIYKMIQFRGNTYCDKDAVEKMQRKDFDIVYRCSEWSQREIEFLNRQRDYLSKYINSNPATEEDKVRRQLCEEYAAVGQYDYQIVDVDI